MHSPSSGSTRPCIRNYWNLDRGGFDTWMGKGPACESIGHPHHLTSRAADPHPFHGKRLLLLVTSSNVIRHPILPAPDMAWSAGVLVVGCDVCNSRWKFSYLDSSVGLLMGVRWPTASNDEGYLQYELRRESEGFSTTVALSDLGARPSMLLVD